MNGWIHDSLAESMATLEGIGRRRLAEELGRVLQVMGDTDDVNWFREPATQEILEDIYVMQYSNDCFDILEKLRVSFGVEHCALFHIRDGRDGESRLLCSSYPDNWVSECEANGYLYLDPYLNFAGETRSTFFWDEVAVTAPVTIQMLQKASRHGIGPAGVSLVVRAGESGLMVVAMSSRQDHAQFRRNFQRRLDDLSAVCSYLIQSFLEISRLEEVWSEARDRCRAPEMSRKGSNTNVIWPNIPCWTHGLNRNRSPAVLDPRVGTEYRR